MDGATVSYPQLIVRPSSATSPRDTDGSQFEIVLASGVVARVPPSFDASALARLLEVLTQARAC